MCDFVDLPRRVINAVSQGWTIVAINGFGDDSHIVLSLLERSIPR